MAPEISQGLRTNVPTFKQYVKLGYHFLITKLFYIMLLPLISILLRYNFVQGLIQLSLHLIKHNLVTMIMFITFLLFLRTLYLKNQRKKVYLINFTCYKPDPSYKGPKEGVMDRTLRVGKFSQEDIDFHKKILESSCLGQETYFPKALIQLPPNPCILEARKEAELVMFGAIDELLTKTKVNAKDIGILIMNCSLFNPIPCLAEMIINHYKFDDSILVYNLGGMGCSASLTAIDLVKHLLQVHENTYALVVSAENITQNWYWGNERSMLISNCIFRVGGAAILLSNKPSDQGKSKYQLIHTIRTHKGAEDKSYGCALQREDDNKILGVSLSKDLIAIAGEAVKANITTLGPLVLPISEQLLYLVNLVVRKALKMNIKPYIPDFKLAFEHICIHPGGRRVLDEMEKNLEFSPWHMEPSRMTLYRFGNTSSSSLWYELGYAEAKGRVKKGHRVWQIGFGSGFKCNSAVWQALNTINPAEEINPWIDEINKFPVQIPRYAPLNMPDFYQKYGENAIPSI